MWVDAAGRRRLLAPSHAVAAFVSAIYDFEEVRVVPVTVGGNPPTRHLELRAGPLELSVRAGRGPVLPAPLRRRPAWFTARVESPLARVLLGVRTVGVSGRGGAGVVPGQQLSLGVGGQRPPRRG